jgi:hypothetical protein
VVANTVNEENLKILRMIEERTITAEQGAQLLAAGNKAAGAPASPSALAAPAPKSGKTRWFRVLVTDTASDKVRVSVRLPLSLVKWGMKVGGQFSPEVKGIDFDELSEIINSETDGKLVEVMDEEDGEHVQIFIE